MPVRLRSIRFGALVLLALVQSTAKADDIQDMIEEATVDKAFIVVAVTDSYDAALRTARRASEVLAVPMDLRGLQLHKPSGSLTFARATCEGDSAFGSYPCYLARGRWDDGAYVSIELAEHYTSAARRRYSVIVASGGAQEPEMTELLQRAKRAFSSAKLQTVPVYLGCIH